ncbi:hypothetical protein, partial [Rhizobium laguerreae]|uniref:hypothetical protein n=1 Tax=Rhizobium laguerreae TaxID=1076926 RepID=UPI00197E0266
DVEKILRHDLLHNKWLPNLLGGELFLPALDSFFACLSNFFFFFLAIRFDRPYGRLCDHRRKSMLVRRLITFPRAEGRPQAALDLFVVAIPRT